MSPSRVGLILLLAFLGWWLVVVGHVGNFLKIAYRKEPRFSTETSSPTPPPEPVVVSAPPPEAVPVPAPPPPVVPPPPTIEQLRAQLDERVNECKRAQGKIAVPHDIGDIVTRDGVSFKGVVVTRVEPDAIYVTHAGGAGQILWSALPKEFQARYGMELEIAGRYREIMEEKRREKMLASAQAAAEAAQKANEIHASNIQRADQERKNRERRELLEKRRRAWDKYDRQMAEYQSHMVQSRESLPNDRSTTSVRTRIIGTRPKMPNPPKFPRPGLMEEE